MLERQARGEEVGKITKAESGEMKAKVGGSETAGDGAVTRMFGGNAFRAMAAGGSTAATATRITAAGIEDRHHLRATRTLIEAEATSKRGSGV
mmetsp:Transcript_108162/g.271208  ORF Transcript_108162/g.271208 Transcript_108162/m.271208 type:complete len:93 (+) Transcript_108162:941-1219(+)